MTRQKMLEFYQQITIDGKFQTNRKNMDAFIPTIVGYTSKNKFKCLNHPLRSTIQKQQGDSVGSYGFQITNVKFQIVV